MTLFNIRLELARTPDHPDGSSACGYEFVAPLDGDGHLDVDGWTHFKEECRVRRFWEHEDDEEGNLIRTRGRGWAFSYEPGDDDDEPIFRFLQHRFVESEYVSITEHDGETRPFRIVSVQPFMG